MTIIRRFLVIIKSEEKGGLGAVVVSMVVIALFWS